MTSTVSATTTTTLSVPWLLISIVNFRRSNSYEAIYIGVHIFFSLTICTSFTLLRTKECFLAPLSVSGISGSIVLCTCNDVLVKFVDVQLLPRRCLSLMIIKYVQCMQRSFCFRSIAKKEPRSIDKSAFRLVDRLIDWLITRLET